MIDKILGLMLLLMLSGVSVAEVYKWIDDAGRVHYGDKPSDSSASTVVKSRITSYDAVTYTNNTQSSGSSAANKKETLVMYSTSWCGYCKKARQYFISQGIPFQEYDIEKNLQAKHDYDALGGKGVPVITMGKKRMNGFSQKSFDHWYGS
jgi:glutaredoxin